MKHGLLTDYKVLVLTVSEAQVSRTLQSSFAANGDLALDDAARIVGCWNALTKQTQDPAGYEASPIEGIPEEAQGYVLGARSGLDWIVERYRVRADKASGHRQRPQRLVPRSRQPPLRLGARHHCFPSHPADCGRLAPDGHGRPKDVTKITFHPYDAMFVTI